MKVNILSIFGIILCATGISQAFVAPRQTFKSYPTPQLHKTEHVTRLQMWGGDGDQIEGTDRALACLPYLLPILDGDHFGNYIFQRAPPLGILNAILVGPLETVYHSIPFLGLICFFGLSFLSRNPNFSQPVRFNMQQAILIDIALIFPDLIGSATGSMHLPRYVSYQYHPPYIS